MHYLRAFSVSCLFIPCNVEQEEKVMHWVDPEHTLSVVGNITDLPDLITDPEVTAVIQPNSTRWLHIFCFTAGLVVAASEKMDKAEFFILELLGGCLRVRSWDFVATDGTASSFFRPRILYP